MLHATANWRIHPRKLVLIDLTFCKISQNEWNVFFLVCESNCAEQQYTQMEHNLPLIPPNKWAKACSSYEGISVATFNSLRRNYSFRGKHWVTEEEKDWNFRLQLHKQLLPYLHADIICIQEAEVDTVEEDFAFMKDFGYDLLKGVTNGKEDHTHTKPSIFYKAPKFQLKWFNHRSRTLLSLFEDEFGHCFYVIGCHLQGGSKCEDQRCFQLKSTFQQLSTHAKSMNIPETDLCAILCGDFNASPHQAVHQLLRNGKLTEDEVVSSFGKPGFNFQHNFRFEDSYANVKNRPYTIKFGIGKDSAYDLIDFLYFTPNTLEVQCVRDPLTREQKELMVRTTCVPNSWHPSDHLPQVALFSFK